MLADSSQIALTKTLERFEKSLKIAESKKEQLEDVYDPRSFQQAPPSDNAPSSFTKRRLAETADTLMLAFEMKEILQNLKGQGGMTIFKEAQLCVQLALFVTRQYDTILEVAPQLYSDIYVGMFDYCYETLIDMVRSELKHYPKQASRILKQCSSETSNLPQLCDALTQVETNHDILLQTLEGRSPDSYTPVVSIELLAPIVQKIKFHFVEHSSERVTSNRIDRLPEWLLGYIKEHVLEGGPLELAFLLQPEMIDKFLQEVVQLAKWVLEERNYFRDPQIAGPRSNPLLLMNTIEEMIQFDKSLQGNLNDSSKLSGLMDLLVSSDEDLMMWWIQRERESLSGMLNDSSLTENIPKPLANHVSPRAEIFCALIQSTQYKASVLASPGLYLREVAVPLSTQFVETLHSTITQLTNDMRGRGMPEESTLVNNIREWIEVILGTELAAGVLLGLEGSWQDDQAAPASQSDYDLARFGRSIDNLKQVMVEEFSQSFVEIILMERAKCASYTMMASHLLTSQDWDGDNSEGVSVELRETKFCLQVLENVCNSIGIDIFNLVLERLAQPFLEVALDVHAMTPDIWQSGAQVFCQDVQTIFRTKDDLPPVVCRLLDTCRLLQMERGLMDALGGLVSQSEESLNAQDFSCDELLLQEAMSMIHAKGLNWVELEDVISILNRRRD